MWDRCREGFRSSIPPPSSASRRRRKGLRRRCAVVAHCPGTRGDTPAPPKSCCVWCDCPRLVAASSAVRSETPAEVLATPQPPPAVVGGVYLCKRVAVARLEGAAPGPELCETFRSAWISSFANVRTAVVASSAVFTAGNWWWKAKTWMGEVLTLTIFENSCVEHPLPTLL